MICALCGAENPRDGRFCAKCGAVLQGQRGMPPPGTDFETTSAPYSGPTRTSGMAIGSLICGILFFFFPTAVVAIILGHLALGQIRRERGRLTGSGLATAGLVLGYGGVAIIPVVLILAAIAIPNLLRAKGAANESSAVGSIRTIVTAEITYQDTYSNGYAPSLSALDGSGAGEPNCDHAQLIDRGLASGRKNGYVFTYIALPAMAKSQAPSSRQAIADGCTARGGMFFTINADPVTRNTSGGRSFFSDQTGVIRYNAQGSASADSPPLE
jgi:type IV pilus assembly protein PilA